MSYKKFVRNKDFPHPYYCPNCGEESTVIYSRQTDEGIERRRKCKKCKYRWNTLEVLKRE